MPLLLLGAVLIIVAVLLVRSMLNTEPRVLARILRWTAAVVGGGVALLLIDSGQFTTLMILAVAATTLLVLRLNGRRWPGLGGGGRVGGIGGGGTGTGTGTGPRTKTRTRTGRVSQVETQLLRMTLDLDSGALSGEVLGGRCVGRQLDQLDFAELMALLDECRRLDPQSIAVLEAWLDRTQSADWRRRAETEGVGGTGAPNSAASSGGMSREEALAILGLEPTASPEAIKEAHHHLMAKVHPDHGGSTWLAAKLNQARDLLLT